MDTKMRTRIQILWLLAGILFLGACASVQRQAAPATPDRPKSGRALVFFYREKKFAGWGVGYNVRDGETRIGGLPNGSYFVYDTTPGAHTFSAATETKAERSLKLEAGKTYYIRGEIEMGMMVGRPYLTIVDPLEGAAAIKGLKRVVRSP